MTSHAASCGQPPELSERVLAAWHRFGVGVQADAHHKPMAACRLAGNGLVRTLPDRVEAFFDGSGDGHRLIFRLPGPSLLNGLSARVRLDGWDSIRYMAFGSMCDGLFRHVRVPNPPQSRWFDITIGYGDIGFGLQNNWEHPEATRIDDVRIHVQGEPSAGGARIEVESFICWEEESMVLHQPATCTRPPILPARLAIPADWHDAVHEYLATLFPHADEQAMAFMTSGVCPLIGESLLPWPSESLVPSGVNDVNTHVFSWHALHPATILLLHARKSGRTAPVFATREVVSQWLDRSYYTPDPDKKYAWYDHGVADRLLALLLIWAEGIERDFDHRFMTRVGEAVVRHAQLLESELFYASHQRTRYHNHAWFQDLALLAASVALPAYPSAARWRDRACERLAEQMEVLVVRDGGFAVCVENSIGYHECVRNVGKAAGALAGLAGIRTVVSSVADELSAFSSLLRYPDGSLPTHGDTLRHPPATLAAPAPSPADDQPAFTILPKAGYGIARGKHDGIPFMFCMFATSLCQTHKHDDDLSFTLFFDGVEWLIDPSFYSHEYRQPLPAYLRSSAAHNTLCLPGVAYSAQPGTSHLAGTCEADAFRFEGSHSCYPDTTVTRTVEGTAAGLSLRFTDMAWGSGGFPDACLMLQCGQGVEVARSGPRLVLSHPRSRYQVIVCMPSERIEIVFGEESTTRIRGVSGMAFMQKVPISTIECVVPTGQPLHWTIEAVSRPGGSLPKS